MTMWEPVLQSGSQPQYLALADAIAADIASGALAPGARLPPQRDLARRLGISLSTVTRAYTVATRRGLVSGTVGRGTFVTRAIGSGPNSPPDLARPRSGPIDFSRNLPWAGTGIAALGETLTHLSARPGLADMLTHQHDDTPERHRAAGARWIGRAGFAVEPESVVITAGAQHGLLVSLLALLEPGDSLLVEALSYAPIKNLTRQLGIRLIPVALDGDGMRPDALDAACRATGARAMYCLPTLHTPTAVTMSATRRRDIAAVMERRGITAIEDDVFGLLPTDRPAPLATFAPDRTIYLTSVSKSIGPGLRVGFVSAPAHLLPALHAAVATSIWMPPPLMTEIVTRLIDDGTADRANAAQQKEADARRALACTALGKAVSSDNGGFHIWVTLPKSWRADAFWAAAKRSGVEVQPAATFAIGAEPPPNAVRLCLSHETDRERVTAGLTILAGLLVQTEPGQDFVV